MPADGASRSRHSIHTTREGEHDEDAMGADPVGNTPEQMKQQINADVGRFGVLATKANLQLD